MLTAGYKAVDDDYLVDRVWIKEVRGLERASIVVEKLNPPIMDRLSFSPFRSISALYRLGSSSSGLAKSSSAPNNARSEGMCYVRSYQSSLLLLLRLCLLAFTTLSNWGRYCWACVNFYPVAGDLETSNFR